MENLLCFHHECIPVNSQKIYLKTKVSSVIITKLRRISSAG